MKTSAFYVVCVAALTVIAMSCTTNTNVNVGNATNRAANTLGNAANSVGNAYNAAANTISNAASSVTGTSDTAFVEEAATGGMAEVELGKVASTKATNPEVKRFAVLMVTDHSKLN